MDVQIVSVDGLSDDPAEQRRFEQWNAVRTESGRSVFGDQHTGWSVDELRERRRGTQYTFTDLAAIARDRVVGMVSLAEPQHDNPELSLLMLAVHPDARRVGVGSRLLAEVEDVIAAHARRTILVETEWAADGCDDGGLHFAAPHGYRNAQTLIRSGMPLPAERARLTAWAQGSGRADAGDFAIEASWDGISEAWLEDRAILQTRMSTDAPLDDVEYAEESWDAERVREEVGWALKAGRRLVEVVARDRSTNRLVGFTRIEVSTESPEVGYQQDTLVLKEARGHGLGLRMKACAAVEVMDRLPQVRVVRTWNADSNEHMLAVNRQLGYEVEGYQREWQKRLD